MLPIGPDFDELVSLFKSIQRNWGEEVLFLFCQSPELNKEEIMDSTMRLLSLLKMIATHAELKPNVFLSLEEFHAGLLNLEDFLEKLENLAPYTNYASVLQEQDISPLINRFQEEVLFPLPKQQLATIQEQYMSVQLYCERWRGYSLAELIETVRTLTPPLSTEDTLQLIAIGRLALYIKYQIYLHNTQILTVLSKLSYNTGCVAQVKTGEGKSMTICLLAFILAMQKKSVHIISSSPNLAIRDQAYFIPFFKSFGIHTSHICARFPPASHFQALILYGVATDFEFAIMREMLDSVSLFSKQRHSTSKRFDCVIIDELDNLTIDTARTGARLAHPALVSYNWIIHPIFQFVKKNFSKDSLETLLSEEVTLDLRSFLRTILSNTYQQSIDSLSQDKLETWLQSCFQAIYTLNLEEDYVILDDKITGKKEICIVDAENTGRLLHGTRWGNGTHEFVEVKHGIEPGRESITPICFNHAVYYEMYKNIYGLTGTLGSKSERDEIDEVYGIESFDVPTFHPNKRQDMPVKIFSTNSEYFEATLKVTLSCIDSGRPILILCETILASKQLADYLQEQKIKTELLNEVQEKSEEVILAQAGKPQAVTIATNTAGRGTDIKLDAASRKNGGLHVLITFFPLSLRVEEQARGRAGRQNDPGSSEIFVSAEQLNTVGLHSSGQLIDMLHKKRTTQIEVMKNAHIKRAALERYMHSLVKKFYALFQQFIQTTKEDRFLCMKAASLTDRRVLHPLNPQLNSLSLLEQNLSKKLTSLLYRRSTLDEWKVALTETHTYLKNKILNQWALEFHQEAENLLNSFSIESHALLQQRLQQLLQADSSSDEHLFFKFLEESINIEFERKSNELKEKIAFLFQSLEPHFNKYLDPTGIGLIHCIRDLTGASLVNIA